MAGAELCFSTQAARLTSAARVHSGTLEHQAINAGREHDVPTIVHEVLHSPGQPLDGKTRAFMEPRFGRDFGQVRLHTDSVEPRVVVGPEDDVFEREARSAAEEVLEGEQGRTLHRSTASRLQRVPAIVGLDEAGPKAKLTDGPREAELAQCLKRSGPDPNECKPSAPLTWADFRGTPIDGSPFGAVTSTPVNDVEVPTQACMKSVLGRTSAPTRIFQAQLDSGKSWVKASARDAADPTKNGCGGYVTGCESFFDRLSAAKRTGGWQAMSSAPDPNCPASIVPRGDRATSKAECATKLGADCTAAKTANAARLLKHEQGHFNISCVLTKKANAALSAGNEFGRIKGAIGAKRKPTQTQYDKDSSHGCDAASQSSWEADIAGGLKNIAIP